VTVPESTLLDVSDSGLPMDTLGLSQPMSIAVHAVRRSGLRAGQEAVIVGIGGIGAFITVAAVATGARVLVVDLNADRLELATRLGAAETLKAGDMTLPERLAELGMDPDVFFEVSGSAPGLASVLSAARPGATIVPLGIQKGEPGLPLGRWTLNEYTIIGSVAHVIATDLPEAVRLLASRDDWSDLAHEVLPLDAVVDDALKPLLDGSASQIKTLIDPWIEQPRPADHTRS
jgi:threonine dehydrogenase-like Zn-dependent dehydrogenase